MPLATHTITKREGYNKPTHPTFTESSQLIGFVQQLGGNGWVCSPARAAAIPRGHRRCCYVLVELFDCGFSSGKRLRTKLNSVLQVFMRQVPVNVPAPAQPIRAGPRLPAAIFTSRITCKAN